MLKSVLVGVGIAVAVGFLGVAPPLGFVLIVLAVLLWVFVFNGHKSKTERMVLKLERTMMAMLAAAQADDLAALHSYGRQQLGVLRWLQAEGKWSEEQVYRFLEQRGLVRQFTDPQVETLLAQAMRRAETQYGLLGG